VSITNLSCCVHPGFPILAMLVREVPWHRHRTELGHRGNTFFRRFITPYHRRGCQLSGRPGSIAPGLFVTHDSCQFWEHMLQYPSNETRRMVSCSGEVVPPC
jgi:hypothetical protein